MHFTPTSIADVKLVELEPNVDDRGSFTRLWCADELASNGLMNQVAQVNSAVTAQAGTLRGLHYQADPHWETKFIRCLRGAAQLVAVDLRSDSDTFQQYVSIELHADRPQALHVPMGFAQGYQTLTDETEILYFMSTAYVPDAARGYRYDDPAFAIQWSLPVVNLSDKDTAWEPFV